MYIGFILKLALAGLILVLIARIGFRAASLSKKYRCGKNRDREDSYKILKDELNKGEIEREQYEEMKKVLDKNCKK